MKLHELKLSPSMIGEVLQCVKTTDWHEYAEDGSKGKVIGTKYSCLSRELNYDKVVLKCKGPCTVDVENRIVPVMYEGATIKPYYDKAGEIQLSIIVEKVEPYE